MKKILIILGVIIVIVGIAVSVILGKVKDFDEYINQIKIMDVDLSKVNDGSYVGSSDSGVIKVRVEVTVKNHEIIEIILLEHRNGKGKNAEAIINDIIDQQRITVDAISGATLSSLVIEDAVQKALIEK